jgi:hypothetical protein
MRPVTTVNALRHQRFTLRLLAAAQRNGLLDLDLTTGTVVARPTDEVSPAAPE